MFPFASATGTRGRSLVYAATPGGQIPLATARRNPGPYPLAIRRSPGRYKWPAVRYVGKLRASVEALESAVVSDSGSNEERNITIEVNVSKTSQSC